MAVPPPQQGTAMMNYVGQFPPSVMALQQQEPQQQQPNQFSFPPFQQFGQLWQLGAGICSSKSNDDVIFNRSFLNPTHNYAFAAAVLLKKISTDAKTIKQWAILDSGATSHFLTTNAPVTNICAATVPLVARLPNGERMQSRHTCTLNLPELPAVARNAHIIPGLALHSLLSVITMCNAGCTVTFTKIGCSIVYHGRTIVCGHKCARTGLWMIPLHSTPLHSVPATNSPATAMAANVEATLSAAKYARYIPQLLCSPPTSTLIWALAVSTKLSTIPGLTPAFINNNLPHSTATNKGHMRRHQSNTASMHNIQNDKVAMRAKVHRMMLQQEACSMQDMFCFAALTNANTGTMYTDLTGSFPVRLFKNMQYIFVAYVYNLNAIIVHAMPTCTNTAMITAFKEVITVLWTRGNRPALNIMDKECSTAVEQYICLEKINIHLVPPHNHWANATEQAIATFKEHFIAALATVNQLCPLQLWDEFLPQVELPLNMLSFSCHNPKISANQEVYGAFDFNKTPLAPLGTKALIYDDPILDIDGWLNEWSVI
jgi:hypothetical protein